MLPVAFSGTGELSPICRLSWIKGRKSGRRTEGGEDFDMSDLWINSLTITYLSSSQRRAFEHCYFRTLRVLIVHYVFCLPYYICVFLSILYLSMFILYSSIFMFNFTERELCDMKLDELNELEDEIDEEDERIFEAYRLYCITLQKKETS